jgi:hypothetical protein
MKTVWPSGGMFNADFLGYPAAHDYTENGFSA